jgi:hypothetical protein
MEPLSTKALFLGTMAAVALLAATSPARAAAPIWAEANWVKANYTECGGTRFIVLKASSAKVPVPATEPGCTMTEETYHKIFVAKALFKPEHKGQLAESNVDAGYIFCKKDDVALLLGSAGNIERAIRQNPVPKGCSFSTRKFQYVSSVGNIPFTNVANGGTMTVAESLAMHAKERQRIIAECNASPACRAEVQRRSARGKTLYTCPPGYYLAGQIDNQYANCVPN